MAFCKSLAWLSGLKASQLKDLATNVGISSSGTKTVLVAALQDHLPKGYFAQNGSFSLSASAPGNLRKPEYIISIDMGIRNLAFCRIVLPAGWPSSSRQHQAGIEQSVPIVTDWARIAVSSPSSSDNSAGRASLMTKEASAATAKEAFDPHTLSQLAYHLITYLLTLAPSHPPTQFLIERQRFRSMGGAAVQEWTLRVNMFEAMLYATLNTLKKRGEWNGIIAGVMPGKVGSFWLADDVRADKEVRKSTEIIGMKSEQIKNRKMSKSAIGKIAKIRIVEEWLQDLYLSKTYGTGPRGAMVNLNGMARKMGEAFLKKRSGERGILVRNEGLERRGQQAMVEIGKLDDLADCFLQGLAWVEWENTRRRILTDGEEFLAKRFQDYK